MKNAIILLAALFIFSCTKESSFNQTSELFKTSLPTEVLKYEALGTISEVNDYSQIDYPNARFAHVYLVDPFDINSMPMHIYYFNDDELKKDFQIGTCDRWYEEFKTPQGYNAHRCEQVGKTCKLRTPTPPNDGLIIIVCPG
jgi:hypothetical protein